MKVFHAEVAWSGAILFIESRIETLTVGKAHHGSNILHVEFQVAAIDEYRHGLVDSVLVDECGIVHVELHIAYSRHISAVGVQVLCQFLGRIVLVHKLPLDEQNVQYLGVQFIQYIGIDAFLIACSRLFVFSDIIFAIFVCMFIHH